jgi:N-glycosylase/DNA lyase
VSTPSSDPVDDRHTLEHYFRLDFDLTNLYTGWSEDENFREKAAWCQGVRLLQQPALETLVAFICSSNNNIIRISTMMNRFCKQYGQCLGTIAGHTFHSFPSLQSLVGVVNEDTLRDMGFGYRARYVKESVEEVGRRGGEAWLSLLRKLPYCEAWAKLCQLPGVGAKVSHVRPSLLQASVPCFRWRTVCV